MKFVSTRLCSGAASFNLRLDDSSMSIQQAAKALASFGLRARPAKGAEVFLQSTRRMGKHALRMAQLLV
jgi:hypothetical protein